MKEYRFHCGFPFFYWDYFKDKTKQQIENQTHEDNINDFCGYSPFQLLITPKYKDLKDEIIRNELYPLSNMQMNISIKKTNKLINTFKAKGIRCIIIYVNIYSNKGLRKVAFGYTIWYAFAYGKKYP